MAHGYLNNTRSSVSAAVTPSSCPNTLSKMTRCRCHAARATPAADMSTYWPSQHSALYSCRPYPGATAGLTQQHKPARSTAAVHPGAPNASSSSSSSSSRRSTEKAFHQQRAAVVTCSISNGRSAYTSQYAVQVDTRQQWQVSSSQRWQQQQQQQLQQQEPPPDPGAKTRLLQQRRIAAVSEQQQQQQQQWQHQQQGQQQQQQGFAGSDQDRDLVIPRRRFVLRTYNRYSGAWYKDPTYSDPKALHAAILQRCGKGSLETDALKQLLLISASPRAAQLALSAVTAVRAVAVSQGQVAPWPDPLLKAFVKMCAVCDCHEVLLSAMQRPAELGFVFKWKSLLLGLKYWGDQCAVDKLEQIAFAMEDAGLPPDERMAYVIVRACVNSGQWDRIDRVLEWFSSKGVHRDKFRPAFMRLLEKAEAAKAAAAVGDGDQGSSSSSSSSGGGEAEGEMSSGGLGSGELDSTEL